MYSNNEDTRSMQSMIVWGEQSEMMLAHAVANLYQYAENLACGQSNIGSCHGPTSLILLIHCINSHCNNKQNST